MTASAKDLEEIARLNEDSAIAIARIVILNAEELRPAHLTELLSVAIWKFTEARGKYDTRYATPSAIKPGAKIRHEHVIPRKTMRLALLERPHRLEQIMRLAIACLVTHEEHQLLNGPDFGWGRYKMAGLTVLDRFSGSEADLTTMAAALESAWEDALTDD